MRIRLILWLWGVLWQCSAFAEQTSTQFTDPKPPAQRIVALAPHITEMLFAIGAGANVVAVSDYSDYPAAAKALPSVASYAAVNIEAVLALKADLVIAWRNGNPEHDLHRLRQFGVRVVYSNPIHLDDISAELRQFGRYTGQQMQAEQVAQAYSAELAQLRRQYQHKKPLKVFFAMGTAPLSTVANNAWPQQLLMLCGADNAFAAAKGDYPQVGIEQVVVAQPEVLILPHQPGVAVDLSYWQRFAAIPAVKQQNYISVDADHLYRTTPRTLLGARQLCQALDAYR
jgi:vitamin B12 transport system substrate-binding protein